MTFICDEQMKFCITETKSSVSRIQFALNNQMTKEMKYESDLMIVFQRQDIRNKRFDDLFFGEIVTQILL